MDVCSLVMGLRLIEGIQACFPFLIDAYPDYIR